MMNSTQTPKMRNSLNKILILFTLLLFTSYNQSMAGCADDGPEPCGAWEESPYQDYVDYGDDDYGDVEDEREYVEEVNYGYNNGLFEEEEYGNSKEVFWENKTPRSNKATRLAYEEYYKKQLISQREYVISIEKKLKKLSEEVVMIKRYIVDPDSTKLICPEGANDDNIQGLLRIKIKDRNVAYGQLRDAKKAVIKKEKARADAGYDDLGYGSSKNSKMVKPGKYLIHLKNGGILTGKVSQSEETITITKGHIAHEIKISEIEKLTKLSS